jgi:hypothetical protein
VARGSNWFFLVREPGLDIGLRNLEALTEFAWRVRQAANAQGHPAVDHVELFGQPADSRAHSRNFVLCPGKAYDRSPCGTGTSAKLACLAADDALAEGEEWIQEGIVGGSFTARYRWLDRSSGRIVPTVAGRAHGNAQATLLLDPSDPFCWGTASAVTQEPAYPAHRNQQNAATSDGEQRRRSALQRDHHRRSSRWSTPPDCRGPGECRRLARTGGHALREAAPPPPAMMAVFT